VELELNGKCDWAKKQDNWHLGAKWSPCSSFNLHATFANQFLWKSNKKIQDAIKNKEIVNASTKTLKLRAVGTHPAVQNMTWLQNHSLSVGLSDDIDLPSLKHDNLALQLRFDGASS